jgi:hypothetical protein
MLSNVEVDNGGNDESKQTLTADHFSHPSRHPDRCDPDWILFLAKGTAPKSEAGSQESSSLHP